MKEEIYLRPKIIGNQWSLVDQDGREVKGIVKMTVESDIEMPQRVTVELLAMNDNGKPYIHALLDRD